MKVAVKWGLILGIVVAVLGFVFGAAGLHSKPIMTIVFVGLAVVVNIAVVILGLRESATSSAWGVQLLNGLVIGVVGAVIIFAGSWIMTSLVFPDYYDEMREGYLAFFESTGVPDDQIERQMQALEATTPASSAMQGAIGTVVTSLVVGAIAGIFLRKK